VATLVVSRAAEPAFSTLMDYAIIKLGNKQHRVRDGETLVVDRLPAEAGKTFEPVVLLGEAKVTATVVAHERGPKLVIGKYRKRTGYKRHNGFRAATSRVEITLGAGGAKKAAAAAKAEKARVEEAKVEEAKVEVEAAKVEAPAVEAEETQAKTAQVEAGLPSGYDELTIAQLKTATSGWSLAELEAALAHEQANAARKGAISALESAIAKDEAKGAEDGT
jgi:large subunit ribosomal protein L21